MSFNFQIESLIALVAGLIICFFGYRCKRITVAIVWFCIGAYFSYTALTGTITDQMLLYFVSGGIGLLCGFVGYGLAIVGLFVTIGFMVGQFIYGYLNFGQIPNIIIAVIIGLFFGLLAIKFVKPLFIISTSISGANAIVGSLTSMVLGISNPVFLVIEIALIVLGILFQFSDCKNLE